MQLDADAKAFLDLLKSLGRPPINSLPPAQAKEVFRRGRLVTQPDLPQVDRVREETIAGPGGPVPVRIYRGAGTADAGRAARARLLSRRRLGVGRPRQSRLGLPQDRQWGAMRCRLRRLSDGAEHVFPAAYDDCSWP